MWNVGKPRESRERSSECRVNWLELLAKRSSKGCLQLKLYDCLCCPVAWCWGVGWSVCDVELMLCWFSEDFQWIYSWICGAFEWHFRPGLVESLKWLFVLRTTDAGQRTSGSSLVVICKRPINGFIGSSQLIEDWFSVFTQHLIILLGPFWAAYFVFWTRRAGTCSGGEGYSPRTFSTEFCPLLFSMESMAFYLYLFMWEDEDWSAEENGGRGRMGRIIVTNGNNLVKGRNNIIIKWWNIIITKEKHHW